MALPLLIPVDDGTEKVERLASLLPEYKIDRSYVRRANDDFDGQELADLVENRIKNALGEHGEIWLVDVFYQGRSWAVVGSSLRTKAEAVGLRSRVDDIHAQLISRDDYVAASLIALLEREGRRFALWSRHPMFQASFPKLAGEIPLDDADGARSAVLATIRATLALVMAPQFGELLRRIRTSVDRHEQCEHEDSARVRHAAGLPARDWEKFLKEVAGVDDKCSVGALLLAGCLAHPDKVEPSGIGRLISCWGKPPLSLAATRWTDPNTDDSTHADEVIDAWLMFVERLCRGAISPLGIQVTTQSASIVTRDEFATIRSRIKSVLPTPSAKNHSLTRALVRFLSLTSWEVLPDGLRRISPDAHFRIELSDNNMLIGFDATAQS